MRSLFSTSSAFALAATLLGVLTAGTRPALAAGQKSCRVCDCNVYFSGNPHFETYPSVKDELSNIINYYSKQFTGSIDEDVFYWTLDPTKGDTGVWHGDAHFWRLCGNGGFVDKKYNFFKYSPNWSTDMQLKCTCDNSVACSLGSDCGSSGL